MKIKQINLQSAQQEECLIFCENNFPKVNIFLRKINSSNLLIDIIFQKKGAS